MKLKDQLRLIIVVMLLFTGFFAHAQVLSFSDGLSVKEADYSNVTGSPYMYPDWNIGTVLLTNGKAIQNIYLKYNQKDDEVYFKNDKEEAMNFAVPVKSFTIIQNNEVHSFQSGFPSGSGITEKTFCEILADGRIKFIKKNNKSIVDSKEYASAQTDRRFMDITKYYVVNGSTIQLIKKDQKSVLSAFPDKQTELLTYIKDNKLNLKNEEDIAKLFMYYNSLKA